MKLQYFNGGLSTRKANHLIAIDEGVEYTNINNESGELKPVKSNSNVNLSVDEFAHYFSAKNTWISSSNSRDYLEYQDNLYYTENNSVPKIFDGTVEYLLGIDKPEQSLLESTKISSGNLNGTYQYVYTFYNSRTGVESAPSAVSTEIVLTNENISLTNIKVSVDPQIDQIRLYRVGGTITAFSLVTTIGHGITSYTDSVADTAIEGTILIATNYYQAQSGLKYLIEAYGIMFGVLGSKVYFTETGKFWAWPPLNFIEFDSTITGIKQVPTGIFVFTDKWTYIITGTSASTFSKGGVISYEQGCLEFRTIRQVGTSIVWLSDDGLCMSRGSNVKVITRDKLGATKLNAINAIVHDEVYYIQTDTSILVFDYRYKQIFKYLTLGTTRLLRGDTKLYGYINNQYYELFKGVANKSISWLSPILLDGSYTQRKTYKEIFVNSTGSILLEIFIDKVSVLVVNLSVTGMNEIDLPQNKKDGYSIQFKATGTGTIFELDYNINRAGDKK